VKEPLRLAQQTERLKELRQDPRFWVPFKEGETPVYFEGGARCDDIYARIHEKEAQAKT
jgi:hypothetical protein